MQMRPTDIRLPGAVPLDPKPSAAAPSTGAGAESAVVEVSEQTFATEVLDRSRTVPVVLDFWASWCGPCRQLSPILERLANSANGEWVLAKIDVDANPRLAQAAAVQGIPAVKAVVDGQVVGEFTGAVPEAQVRQWISEVLAVANGAPPATPADPGLTQGDQALERGDLDGAAAAYREVLDRAPGDPEARAALAQVELLRRTGGVDERAARRRADAAPSDVDAAITVADLDVLAGRLAEAFDRLVALVRTTTGAERDRVREHLISLFEAVGPDDSTVARARRDLTSALF
jgi:putative thioredoxin